MFAKNWFNPRASFPLPEQPLRAKLKICTEADYLQAHLTVIEGESRRRDPAFYYLRQRVTSILKKLIGSNTSSTPSAPSRERTVNQRNCPIGMSLFFTKPNVAV